MEVFLSVGHGDPLLAVIGRCVALAKVVGFHLGRRAANPLPVNLVQVVRFENGARDNARAWGGLHHYGDHTEENVPVGLHGGRIAGLCDGVGGAVGVIVGDISICHGPVITGALRKVYAVTALIETLIRGASLCIEKLAMAEL